MIKDLVQAIGPEFTAFLRPFERFFDNPGTVQHFRNYTRGLLTDLDRKTAEPLAKYAGTPARCLQQFLKACLWDHDGLTDGVQQNDVQCAAVAELPARPRWARLAFSTRPVCSSRERRLLACSGSALGYAGKVANAGPACAGNLGIWWLKPSSRYLCGKGPRRRAAFGSPGPASSPRKEGSHGQARGGRFDSLLF